MRIFNLCSVWLTEVALSLAFDQIIPSIPSFFHSGLIPFHSISIPFHSSLIWQPRCSRSAFAGGMPPVVAKRRSPPRSLRTNGRRDARAVDGRGRRTTSCRPSRRRHSGACRHADDHRQHRLMGLADGRFSMPPPSCTRILWLVVKKPRCGAAASRRHGPTGQMAVPVAPARPVRQCGARSLGKARQVEVERILMPRRCPGGHVGGDQQIELATAQLGQRAGALALQHVAMRGGGARTSTHSSSARLFGGIPRLVAVKIMACLMPSCQEVLEQAFFWPRSSHSTASGRSVRGGRFAPLPQWPDRSAAGWRRFYCGSWWR